MTILNVIADDDEYVVDTKTAWQLCQLYDKTLDEAEEAITPAMLYANYPDSYRVNLEPLMDWLRTFD